MKKTIKCLVKSCFGSSDGTHGLFIKEEGKTIYFNTLKCRKIKGIDGYVGAFLTNNVKVFTPAEIEYNRELVSIKLTAEDIEFVAERVSKPNCDLIKDYIEVDEVK